jgi:hypothetical protein
MWISGRETWKLVSFDPRFPEKLQLHTETLISAPAAISVLKQRLGFAIEKAKGIMA